MKVFIKGKFEHGVGTAAYAVVKEGCTVAQGSKRLGENFTVGGQTFPCDQFSTEILAAICGVARCGRGEHVEVFSNNKVVVSWLTKGSVAPERKRLLDIWRVRSKEKKVKVSWIPFYERDPSGNEWNRRVAMMAYSELQKDAAVPKERVEGKVVPAVGFAPLHFSLRGGE